MYYTEDDFLLLSGIQHYAFCRRQWALIHIENVWIDNERTVSGSLMHERAHDPYTAEKRGDWLTVRNLPVLSRRLGVVGKCDVVEFWRDDNGVPLHGRKGRWRPCPVKYKRGSPKMSDVDRLQLCAQALCLEEMLCCAPIDEAYLYYGETRRREVVLLAPELRAQVETHFDAMHRAYAQRNTPRVKTTKSCNACSIKDACLPKLPTAGSVQAYIDEFLAAVQLSGEQVGNEREDS